MPDNVRTRIPQGGYWVGTVGVFAARSDNPLRIFPALGCYIAGYIGGGGTGHAHPLARGERLYGFSQASCVLLSRAGSPHGRLTLCTLVTTLDARNFARERGLPTGRS